LHFPRQITINSLDEIDELARELSDLFKIGDIISINGDLGSGKTTLIKNICSYYKIENVTSPSFSIVNEYEGLLKVYHFDFYRIRKLEELYDIGFEDYTNDSESIIFIEWGNIMSEIIPTIHYEITIDLIEKDRRLIGVFRKK
jgi:tRNA threonylcarbamoyladenosine biosynthesis protein TsaE